MNIEAQLSKVHNAIKSAQIEEDDLTPENFSEGAFMAGAYWASKVFNKIRNGELTEYEVKVELAKTINSSVIN